MMVEAVDAQRSTEETWKCLARSKNRILNFTICSIEQSNEREQKEKKGKGKSKSKITTKTTTKPKSECKIISKANESSLVGL